MTLAARYPGVCTICSGSIQVGEQIESSFGKGWMHAYHDPADAAASITITKSRIGDAKPKKTRTPRSCVLCSTRTDIRQVRTNSGKWVWSCTAHAPSVVSYRG